MPTMVGEPRHPTFDVTTPESVSAERSIRHFDELSEDDQTTFVSALAGDDTATVSSSVQDGDVIVFTDYYQVRRA